MNINTQGVAKRLTFSLVPLVVFCTLGGCAVYPAPGPYGAPYAYGTDVNGQPVYAAPQVYAAPAYAPNPYYYDPLYVGPPVSLNFGFRSWGGYRGYGPGYRGAYRGGYRGAYRGPGRHR
ncbi:MAG: hypothetical protein ABIP46_00795 [Polaromonas sp.]